jgi:hypothetical protein
MRTSTRASLPSRAMLVGAATCGAVFLGNLSAAGGSWQHSSATYIEFQDTCRDGVRFGGAVLVTGIAEPHASTAVAAQPAPANWPEVSQKWAMRRAIKIPFLTTPQDIPVDDPTDPTATATVDHMGRFTLRYDKQLQLGTMALNLEDANPQSTVNTAEVTDCYLFAPVDIQPGSSANKVPIGRGKVTVAVLSTKTFAADKVDSTTYRFGPKAAKPASKALRDVNKDKRRDLVLTFSSKAAGLKCTTTRARLTGTTTTGGKLEGSGKVRPTGCPR